MNHLAAKGLSLTIGNRAILKEIDLRLEAGRVTALLGPNGAGKSSLLRLLSGEWTPDRGEVVLNGRPLKRYAPRELGRIRAYLQQDTTLSFAFTVLEVVLLGRSPHMHGGERPRDYASARAALRTVDLADREEDLITSLSGGEKQRVHLARVLAQMDAPEIDETRYLFLDEPGNNLDLSHQQAILQAARALADGGIAVCVVLHDLNQALQTADTIAVLKEGEMALQGTPAEIVASPELEKLFGVPFTRLEVTGLEVPYLVPRVEA